MDIKQNILFAKKHIINNIYSSVKIEGIAMTFPETETIFKNGTVENKSFDDISFVNDLKRAWQYVFEHVYDNINIDTIKTLNRIAGKFTVLKSGIIRDSFDEPIRIIINEQGDDWYPELPPSERIINEQLSQMFSNDDKVEAALDLYLYISKGQLFNDGNKRTASLACNMFLIQNGQGLFYVPPKKYREFLDELVKYYVEDDKSSFKAYLKGNCIQTYKETPFGQKVQELREEMNISRKELSMIAGITEQQLYDIEKDIIKTDKETAICLCNFFNREKNLLRADYQDDEETDYDDYDETGGITSP